MTGLHLAQYRIESELGRGGMGIVYRATDTKLNRAVALKVLPAAALSSEDDRARFFREAQAAAQLHHPNIATVFGIDEAVPHAEGSDPVPGAERRPFIAMEYIEGETLQAHVKKGPLRLTEAVSIATQVAEALKAAHAKGIVHRDIKSANVMLTPDGVAKVLDFGLAKTNQSTILTRIGSTLGTVAYMSPEQARGEEVDGRSDLYSLGTVLYEMVAGRLPFAGDFEQAVVYGILNEPPEPLTSVRTGVSMDLERLVNKLLTKEADYRYQTAADLIADLKSLDVTGSGHSRRSMPSATMTGTQVAAATKAVLPKWVWPVVAAAAFVVGAAAAWWAVSHRPSEPVQVIRFPFLLPMEERIGLWGLRSVSMSRDGSAVVYTTGLSLYLRYLSDVDSSVKLLNEHAPELPTFSPDGQWVAFESTSESLLMRIPVRGGSAVTIADLPARARSVHWAEDGHLYFSMENADAGILRVPEGGGAMETVLVPPDSIEAWAIQRVELLPDGRSLLFSTAKRNHADPTIWQFDLETKAWTKVIEGYAAPRYIRSLGLIAALAQESVFGIPYDASRGVVTGNPFPILEDVEVAANSGDAQWDVSAGGTAIRVLSGGGERQTTRLGWYTEDGGTRVLVPDPYQYWLPQISPDGRSILVSRTGTDAGTWAIDAARGTSTLVHPTPMQPIWELDSQRMTVLEDAHILSIDVDNPSDVDTLAGGRMAGYVSDWSPDGRYLMFWEDDAGLPSSDLRYLDRETGRITDFLVSSIDKDFAQFSPDGRWIAYETDKTGSEEIFLMDFPAGNRQIQVSSGGGRLPKWTSDGRGIYYALWSGRLARVDVDPDAGRVGAPRFLEGVITGGAFPMFDLHPDGRVLVLPPETEEAGYDEGLFRRRLEFIVNWTSELESR